MLLYLIDYAGFNLRIAAFSKSIGIPTHYYIAPKVWAWNEKRVIKLKKFVDHLYVIFPFEKPFFENKHQYPVHFVGNPLQDVISNRKTIDEKEFSQKIPSLGRQTYHCITYLEVVHKKSCICCP
jgi:lipid-A-disaccharide synthase